MRACCHASVFAAQGSVESDVGISIRYAISMLGDIFVFQAGAFDAQGPAESDLGISIRYECSVLYAYGWPSVFFILTVSLHRGPSKAICHVYKVCVFDARCICLMMKPQG